MSATLNKEEINCAKSVYNFNESIKVECKIDGLEECEILSAIPRLTTPKSETADGSIKVYGKVTYFVAYKKDGCIKRAETSAEYSFTLKNDNVKSDQTATVTATVLKTEEYYSSNTLLLTTTIELNCDLKKSCRVAFVSQGQDVILKTEMTPIAKSFGKKQNKLTITEEFELPKLIDEVIYHTESAFVTDCKAGIGSILVDGECVITSYILQKNANSDIVKESHTFPFRLEIDEEHAMPTMQAIATASVEDATVSITSYEETGLSKVKAEIVLLLEGETFDLTETPIAVDAYSTTEDLDLNLSEISFEQKEPSTCLTEKFCERISFEDLAVGTRIMTAYPNGAISFSSSISDQKLTVEATIGFTALFKDIDGVVFSKQFTLPLLINTDFSLRSNQTATIHSFYATDFNVKQISLGELEVYGTVRFLAHVTTKNTLMALLDATVKGEIAPNDNAFTVYSAICGEDLWGLSKRIHVSPDEILSYNNELDFPLSGNERILIYRQKTKEYT